MFCGRPKKCVSAIEPRPSSRLGCQLVITSELEGLLLHLPAGANNIMDNIPFQDAR